MSDLELTVRIDERAFRKYVERAVEKTGRVEPALAGCTDPTLKIVEYGADDGKRLFSAKNPPEEYKQWIGRRYNLSGAKRDAKARQMYYLMQKQGMPPVPIVRPALHSVVRRISSQRNWFNHSDASIMEFTRLLAEEIKRQAKEKDIPMSQSIVDKTFYGRPAVSEKKRYRNAGFTQGI